MDQRKKKKRNTKKEYIKYVFNGILDVLKFHQPEDFPNDIFTINYIADTHKSISRNTTYCPDLTVILPIHSFTYYEKIISVIAKEVMTKIETELSETVFFSIYINSLPDTDESAIFIRFVNDDGIPVKHFLDIINKRGDNALQIMDIVHIVLEKYNLNRSGFMGLSYDINSNLPRHSSDLKASLKVINEYAEIIPCSSDSISSVMAKAVSIFHEGNEFFTTIDELFNFISTIKMQDDIQYLFTNLYDDENLTKNKLLQYLNGNWSTVVNALFQINKNMSFYRKLRNQAFVIMTKVKRLETCILAMFWEEIIEQATMFEEDLHLHVSTEIDFYKIYKIYQSLLSHLQIFQTEAKYMDYKTRAIQKSKILHFNNRNHTEQPQMRFPVDFIDNAENFKTNTYFSIVNEIHFELNDRLVIYKDLAQKFNFFNKIPHIRDSELKQKHENLQKIYLELTFHIDAECMDLKNLFTRYLSLYEDYPTSIIAISNFIRLSGFKEHFSELSKVLKMALCIPALNCPIQQSSSTLKNVITSLKSITDKDKDKDKDIYNSLLIINMEWQHISTMGFNIVIKNFIRQDSIE